MFAYLILGFLILAGAAFFFAPDHRRRLLYARWLRLRKWEFWPFPVLYFFLIPRILYRSFRRGGSPLLCTVTNPALPASGISGESKESILRGFRNHPALPAHCFLRHTVSFKQRLEDLHSFWESLQKTDFPTVSIVLKPDRGQRGRGVQILHSREQLQSALSKHSDQDLIAQEYIPGVELGVFYYRHPDQNHGILSSLTAKVPVSVTGDGEQSINQLILSVSNLTASAPTLLRENAFRLSKIPAPGEIVQLSHVGSHARGALFQNGSFCNSPALLAAVEDFLKQFEGFFYGRFDLKAPSWEHFQRGEDIRILELNGLSSEPTHIYAPGTSWAAGQKILWDHWRVAIEIACANRLRGHQPLSLKAFLKLALKSSH